MALKGQKTTSDFLDWDKMQTIVLKLERDNNLKFALLIATGSYIGLRISDLLQLRWNQVLNEEYFTITEKKTKKNRKVTINPELQTILKRLFIQLEAKETDLMFVNRFGEKPFSVQYVNSKLKDIFTKYSVRGQYSSHFMRKTLGRRVWEVNKYSDQALLLLSQLFNHASVSTTKIYLGIREQEISNLYLSV
ncbi:tyrosine-type recombinase/integrase [Flavobacterium sp. TAB 87]|uniref:tyrosine-type recombinase/integrase n=1 Tax=Flavobacterium sp. TAB 87 TaxID=1729581 RepID=UPI00076C4642|nr:tyrosine-type recombinase/integrase [Flavobacterium sp. TAB 87]KVV15071.1 site-specific tyrosine recombinase XerC [Flavobacterium sp. TAB 87]